MRNFPCTANIYFTLLGHHALFLFSQRTKEALYYVSQNLETLRYATTTTGLTLVSISLSVVITFSINIFLKGGALPEGLMIAILVPAIIAPIMSVQILRLLSHLDEGEERLQLLSNIDDLTQTYNRRYFMQFGEQELKRAQCYGETFLIALLHMDNFKQINDQCGHLMGDQVLRELSRLFREQIRETDVFARYGGDEFIFLFPKTSKKQTQIWVERIFEGFAGMFVHFEGLQVQPLFGMGIASLASTTRDLDDLLKQADFALYHAKKSGGNQFVLS